MKSSVLAVLIGGLLLAGCSKDKASEPGVMGAAGAAVGAAASTGNLDMRSGTNPSLLQCGKDTDCKGDRICEKGTCVSPAAQVTQGAIAASPAGAVATALPLCQANDARVHIAVWTPTNKQEDGDDWTPKPPQNEGQIVYIDAAQWTESGCGVDNLNTLSFPDDPKDVMQGGLAVNLRGNTQVADGLCYYKGFYRNESVPGVHQGWVETFFGAVEKDEVLKSDRYCLERPLP
jgi:hypothetical protein